MERLNYGGEKKNKSPIGGCCTICLFIALVALTAWKGSELFKYDGTYDYQGTLPEDEEFFISESSLKFVFGLVDGVQMFEIDRKKIDVYVEHNFFKYDQEGNRTITKTRYEIG